MIQPWRPGPDLSTSLNQNTTKRVEGRTNEQHGLGSAPSARKGVCVTLCILRAFVDYHWRVFFVKLLQKQLGTLLTVSLPCLHLLLPPGDCCQLPLSVFLRQLTLCLLWDLPLLVHFRSRGRSRAQALCLGFAPKQTKRSSDQRTHTHSTQWSQFLPGVENVNNYANMTNNSLIMALEFRNLNSLW